MDNRRGTVLRRACARATLAISLVLALAGCGGLAERPAEGPTIYYDLGDEWTTTKSRVRLYDCRTGSMVCTGPASYLNVDYQCRCA